MVRALLQRSMYVAGLLLASCLISARAASAPQLSASTIIPSPASEAGAPLLRNFSPAEYGGAGQTWAVTQDPRGVIYVGSIDDGVLEYDGVRWRRIPIGVETTVRSLAVDAEGRVYVGAVGELGYLAPDSVGRMQYVSLLDRLLPEDRDFADVWRTFATPEGIYFATFNRLIRIAPNETRVWRAAGAFHRSFRVRNTIYVREVGRGLLKLVGNELLPVPGGERFAHEKIYAMLPWPQHPGVESGSAITAVLIGTRTQGWFVHDGESLRRWTTQADAAMNQRFLYEAIWLSNGVLAAATLQGGVFLLDSAGRLLGRIDQSSGLANPTVYDLFQDRQGALWLALDNGVARVDITAPLTHFEERLGLKGSVIAMHRHAGVLHAGTTQGLYRLSNAPGQTARFVATPEVQGHTRAFLEWDGALLIGNLHGVFELRDGTAKLARSSEHGTSSLLRSRLDPARVFIGMQHGIAAMRNENGEWIDEGVIADIADQVRTMFQDQRGSLWLGTRKAGVARLRFQNGGAARSLIIERFGVEHGLPAGPNDVYAVADAPVFATVRGILAYDETAGRFVADPRFANLFADKPRRVFPVTQQAHGRVWMGTVDESRTTKETGLALRGANGVYSWDPKPLRQMSGYSIWAIHADADGIVWFGGDGAIYRYDPHHSLDYRMAFPALVREVSDRNGGLVFGGAGLVPTPQLAYAGNAVRFEFAAADLLNQPNRFQAYLEGVDGDWSPWRAEAYRDYTNIQEGAYRFRVRAMNTFGAVSEEATYDFIVLPPWYRTWVAYLAYVALAAATLWAASRWRSAALRRRNEELAALVSVRTEELSGANRALQELSVTDTLTGLKNRRYLVDRVASDVAAVRRAYQKLRGSEEAATSANSDLLFVLIDIDHFKQVNDHYGHAAGDRVLEQFARILHTVCRESDTAVRWGGEEFMIVARFTDRDSGPVVAERIRAMTAAHIFVLDDGKTLRRTCSIGFASFPVYPSAPERFTWEHAVELADQCLYRAKRSGRNTWLGAQGTLKVPPRDDFGAELARLDALLAEGSVQLRGPERREERYVALG